MISIEEGRIIYATIIKDEYFKDNLLLCNERGDILIFDLPFMNNGRKIWSY